MSWIGRATGAPGGLLMRGGPGGRRADLLIGADAVTASRGESSVPLRWEDFATWTTSTDRRALGPGEAWTVSVNSKSGWIGLDSLRTVAMRNTMLTPLGRRMLPPTVLPLWYNPLGPDTMFPPANLVKTLLQLLRERTELRGKLSDQVCTSQLAADIGTPLGPIPIRSATSPKKAAVLRSLESLGYTFPYGRPLPADRKDPLEVILEKVSANLAHNPWQAREVDQDSATTLIYEHYINVAPWPFQALGL